MLKKLLIVLVLLLVLGVVVVFATIGSVLPWSVARNEQLITTLETSVPTQLASPTPTLTAISTLPAAPLSTEDPANPASSPIPVAEQLSPVPICFAPQELLPFAFTPDGARLMVRASSGVQIFNLKSGVLEAFIHASANVISTALSPDGQVLAWALDDNTIQLLRISDQKVLHTLSGHTDMVTKLRFSPDGDFLVSASHDYWVRIWNLLGEELHSIQAWALGIAISPDGSMLATVPSDGPVALWDTATGEKIKELSGSGGYDTSDAEFSPDGQYLAADLVTGLFLWQISDSSLMWNQVKNSMAVAYSPDGQYLAYSDVDDSNKIILAAPDTGQLIRVIDKVQSPVWALFFSPDASLLAATDGVEIRIWHVEDGTLVSIGKAACP